MPMAGGGAGGGQSGVVRLVSCPHRGDVASRPAAERPRDVRVEDVRPDAMSVRIPAKASTESG